MSAMRLTLSLVLVLALLAPGASTSLAQPAASPAATASPAAPGAMLIVENAGQWPAAARFQVWNSPLGPGTTWLAEDAIWLVVASGRSQVAGSEGRADPLVDLQPANLQPATFHTLRLTFPGSNPDVRIEPFDPRETTVSYFLGNDPAQWRPDVPVWGGVRYVDLYPGVDLVFSPGDAAWRLEAMPGTATEQVRVQVEGANVEAVVGTSLRLAISGQPLSVAVPTASFIYQAVGVSETGHGVALAVHAASQQTRAPVPKDDPGDLIYSSFLGGTGFPADIGRAIAVDGAGSAYVTGDTGSTDFPITPGAFDPSFNGGFYDAYVAKVDPTGSALVYATFLGGSGSYDVGYSIAVDAAGNTYVTGSTDSPDLPTTPGAFDTTYNGNYDAFVTKLNAAGSALVYSTYVGGSDSDSGYALAVDVAGNAYAVGATGSSNFPTTIGVFDPTFNGGGDDAFAVKLNAACSALVYSTFLGGRNSDSGYALAVDAAGNAYAVGATGSSNFPTTTGAFDPTFNGGGDAFAAKLNAVGSALIYSTYLGGSGAESGHAIAVDGVGSAYVTGSTPSADFPTTASAFDPTFNGALDGFAVKLNSTGSGLAYATFLGGTGVDGVSSIAVDGTGHAYVSGNTTSSDFPTTANAFDTSFNGGSDAIVVKLNSNGSGLDYSTFLGGSEGDHARIAIDGQGRAYATGSTSSADFPTTPGAFDPSFNGGAYGDAFVAKLRLELYIPEVIAPIEQPSAGAFVSGAVTLRGFAIDLASAAGTGIDMVHIYLDGPYGTGTIIGGATYGLDRPDIAAQYGARFGPSGWELAWNTSGLAPGVHRLYLYAHRTTDNAWSVMDPHLVIAPGGPARWLPIVLRRQ